MERRKPGMTRREEILFHLKDMVQAAAREASVAGVFEASTLINSQVSDGKNMLSLCPLDQTGEMSPGTLVDSNGELYGFGLGRAPWKFTPDDWLRWGLRALEAIEKLTKMLAAREKSGIAV